MASNVIHRKEEESVNVLLLSGRIVSKIFYSKKIINKEEKKYVPQCTFVILNINDIKISPFKIVCEGKEIVKKIKKYATEGCRIVMQGKIISKRRTKANVKRIGLERYTTIIYMTQLINIYDTLDEHDNKFDAILKQAKIIGNIEKDIYPTLSEFESEY